MFFQAREALFVPKGLLLRGKSSMFKNGRKIANVLFFELFFQ
jgi:hypothetical protein